jgi:hypothetical protein
MTLAKTMATSGLMPSALRNKPADILIVLMAGRELGIGPMQSVQDINVIQGKPVYSADLMVALCKRSRVCEFFRLVEGTDERATYETKRVGSPQPETLTFTIEDAKRLGLTGRDNYQKQPKTMLRHRAAAALARDVYPDLVRGYDPDEALDFAQPAAVVDAPPPPRPPEPAVERVVDLAEEDNQRRGAKALVAQVEAAAQILDAEYDSEPHRPAPVVERGGSGPVSSASSATPSPDALRSPAPATGPVHKGLLWQRIAKTRTAKMAADWAEKVCGSRKSYSDRTEEELRQLAAALDAEGHVP